MRRIHKPLLLFVALALLLAALPYVSGSTPALAAQTCTTTEPVDGTQFARLMHDPQWMPWPSRMHDPGWHTGYNLEWYPETVQLWTRPRGGDGRFRYPVEWLYYLRALQLSDEHALWLVRVGASIFTFGNNEIPILNLEELKEEPQAEAISSGGNVVKVLEIASRSIRIETLFFRYDPPDPREVNYTSTPWLVTKFTSISYDGEVGNAGGIDVYFPNLARQEEGYWVDMQRVELFPALPYCATVEQSLVARVEPNELAIPTSVVARGETVVITRYVPRGSDVWGETDYGWVRLVYQLQGQPIYDTSWSMETRPPIYISYRPFVNLMIKPQLETPAEDQPAAP